MPITTSAFLPPSPLLIPEIGKENTLILKKTLEAYNHIAAKLEEAETDLIIIISPYGNMQNNNISLNVHPELKVSFQEFGLLSTLKTFRPALALADNLKKTLENSENAIRLSSQSYLDYGSAVALQLLSNNLKNIKVLPLFPAINLDRQYHFEFGKKHSHKTDGSKTSHVIDNIIWVFWCCDRYSELVPSSCLCCIIRKVYSCYSCVNNVILTHYKICFIQ
jgi:aromatic ring-opening dioxygenase LigB subunit